MISSKTPTEVVVVECSYCGKIRISKIQWIRPIPEHIEPVKALLSHGICPECYEKICGEYKMVG
jgi:NMD protein affecting ribosome stability and mRNA decay